jgi:two-component system, cell cycle sensor histidine kinase and response regulator CckA
VETTPGEGSTFRIYLPEAQRPVEATAAPAIEDVPRGSETVLLVEDEPAVREVMTEQLQSLGYRVLACGSAKEALTTAAGFDGTIDLLLTDVVMPGMNGHELAVRLTGSRRNLRVLYASGYGEDVVARHGILENGFVLLEKPYSQPTLARQIRRALAVTAPG